MNELALIAVLTFSDVQPIFVSRCYACHTEQIQPGKDWTIYENAHKYAGTIKFKLKNKEMPPYNNVTGLTDEEREKIIIWIDQGAKK